MSAPCSCCHVAGLSFAFWWNLCIYSFRDFRAFRSVEEQQDGKEKRKEGCTGAKKGKERKKENKEKKGKQVKSEGKKRERRTWVLATVLVTFHLCLYILLLFVACIWWHRFTWNIKSHTSVKSWPIFTFSHFVRWTLRPTGKIQWQTEKVSIHSTIHKGLCIVHKNKFAVALGNDIPHPVPKMSLLQSTPGFDL